MTTNFVQKGVELIKNAVEKDNAKEYEDALTLYAKGIQYLMTALKYEKSAKVQSTIKKKIKKFLKRAEDIKSEHCPSFSFSTKIKKKKRRVYHLYPTQHDINEAIHDAKPKTIDIINGYVHESEKSLNIKYNIPTGIIKLCLVYYHIPITSDIVMERPNVKWNHVAGLESSKQFLKESVILPIKFPTLFINKRADRVLLYGPPGVGKSYLAKAVGTEANNASYFHISISDLFCKCTGQSEKVIKSQFNVAKEMRPSIMVFDDIDSFHNRSSMMHSCKIRKEFLIGMDSVNITRGIYVIGISNCPWDLDPVIRRRFNKRIYISLPEKQGRKKVFTIHIGNTPNNLSDQDYETLAEMTEGYSGSDISCFIQDAMMEPVRSLQNATHFKRVMHDDNSNNYDLVVCDGSEDGAIKMRLLEIPDDEQDKIKTEPLEMRHFLRIIQAVVVTMSQQDLQRYIDWKDEFGEGE